VFAGRKMWSVRGRGWITTTTACSTCSCRTTACGIPAPIRTAWSTGTAFTAARATISSFPTRCTATTATAPLPTSRWRPALRNILGAAWDRGGGLRRRRVRRHLRGQRRRPNQLFHNVGGKRFEEVGEDQLVSFAQDGKLISGMGADFRDVFNTGRPAIWVSALEQQTFPLFARAGNGPFQDWTARAGLAWQTSLMAGWSNAIVDLDNDGWKDLIVARSNVTDNIALFSQRAFEEPNAVLPQPRKRAVPGRQRNGRPGVPDPGAHRGLAFGDLDNDGRMDIAVSVWNGQAKIFHNTTRGGNHWLLLQLRAPGVTGWGWAHGYG